MYDEYLSIFCTMSILTSSSFSENGTVTLWRSNYSKNYRIMQHSKAVFRYSLSVLKI